MKDAQLWLAKNIKLDNLVAKMAARSFQTERTFAHRFKKSTGFTPKGYIQAVRIERARHLLETTRKPVQEVSYNVGYRDMSSFRRIFSREVGMPPTEYRRRFKLPPTEIQATDSYICFAYTCQQQGESINGLTQRHNDQM